jgi:uncharacterized membrane protein (DUF106 family)
MVFDSVLDFLLGWLTTFHPTLALFIFAFIVALITTLAFKYFSDQKEMKRLKSEMKELRKEMKLHRSDQKKMMATQKKLLKLQGQYNKHMWKVNLYTIIPIIILFSWLNAHFAYFPIEPNEPFNLTLVFDSNKSVEDVSLDYPEKLTLLNKSPVNSTAEQLNYTFQGEKGQYNLSILYNNRTFYKNVVISDKQEYAPVEKGIKDSALKRIKLSNKPMRINLGIHMHWIFAYIIFSMALSPILRKVLKVY